MKKIMFNDRYGLTKAVLEGRKTMTRRIVPEKVLEAYYDYDDYVNAVAPRDIPCTREYEEEFFLRRARFEVGEVVAVAQSYLAIHEEMMDGDYGDAIYDPFRWAIVDDKPGWGNKMFVKADLMPHQIRIRNVRVERLQVISDEDCLKEGIEECWYGEEKWYKAFDTKTGFKAAPTPREAFAALIDKVSGKGIWESNPWVFVYEFELVK